jgi:hypothetical protein
MFSGLLISIVGLGIFVHGKRAEDLRSLGVGLALMVFPFFVHSVLLMWLIGGACAVGWFLLPRAG